MNSYRKLLVAIDLSTESDRVIERAMEIADQHSERINLIHVVEPVAAAYPIDAYAINMTRLQEEALEVSGEKLAGFAQRYGLSDAQQSVAVGSPAGEIRNKADELGCDLIVIGSHGTTGWKLLLGSTANKVLHGAKCDILTVRVGE
jgi:universal stress protein A